MEEPEKKEKFPLKKKKKKKKIKCKRAVRKQLGLAPCAVSSTRKRVVRKRLVQRPPEKFQKRILLPAS